MARYGQKGVVLFIVEGASDKIALGLPMSRIINSDSVQFAIIHGDCLDRNSGKAVSTLQNCIRDIMYKYSYKKSDFIQIVHIVDTDGSFIPDDRVIKKNTSGVSYCQDHIKSGEPQETIARHHRRRFSAEMLVNTDHIMKIPYGIYFMSRNLEHVTQGVSDSMNSGRKVSLAESFADEYYNDPLGFLDLLFSDDIASSGSYKESWKDIMTGTNSLERKCNLNIYLNSYYNALYSDNR